MDIKFQPQIKSQNLSFKAKNQEIKKADDIQRKVNHEFPTFSFSNHYVTNRKHLGMSGKEFNGPNAPKAMETYIKLQRALNFTYRTRYSMAADSADNIYNLATVVKQVKRGNCAELANITLGALYANGYYDFETVYPVIKTVAKNEKTGRVAEREDEIDHRFVKGKFDGVEVVIDPWLNLADSESGYRAKIQESILASEIDKAKEKGIERLSGYCSLLMRDKDTKVSQSLVFKNRDSENMDLEERKKLGEKMLQQFPDVVMK